MQRLYSRDFSPLGACVLQALYGKPNNSPEGRYTQGYVDGYLANCHNDGKTPKHHLEVCVPLDDPYRIGFLEGRANRS
jgi:hypothetical protein